ADLSRSTRLQPDLRERCAPCLERFATRRQTLRDRMRLGPTQTHDANSAAAGRSRDGDDGVSGGEHRSPESTVKVEGPQSERSTVDAFRLSTVDSRLATLDYFRSEISTVFENASPTLSVVTPATSATAMCTMRRSYGLSGPSC